jgi:peptide/nickel transport system substrate-binding protein
MKNNKLPFGQVASGLMRNAGEDSGQGISRRDLLRGMAAGTVLAVTAGGLMTGATSVYAQTPRRGGRIKVASATGSTSDTLDPARGGNYTDYCRHFMFYNGLTTLDEFLVPRMTLAESIDTTDATSWVIKLRKDVVFHDGKPFTAADVVYSLTRHKDLQVGSKVLAIAKQFEEVKASGPHEVRVRLVSPNADLPSTLATSHFLIVRDGTTDFSSGNGTGPFKCAEFQPGVRSIGVRNDSYWKPGQPYLDEIRVHRENRLDPECVLRGERRHGRRGVAAERGDGLYVRLDAGPSTGVRASDDEHSRHHARKGIAQAAPPRYSR